MTAHAFLYLAINPNISRSSSHLHHPLLPITPHCQFCFSFFFVPHCASLSYLSCALRQVSWKQMKSKRQVAHEHLIQCFHSGDDHLCLNQTSLQRNNTVCKNIETGRKQHDNCYHVTSDCDC